MLLKNKRLLLVFEMCGAGLVTADIGTDHAYLPIALAREKSSPHCYAADIRPGPLAIAAENIKRAGLSDKITPILSDGLKELEGLSIEQIVIAGMGAETIAGILERSKLAKHVPLILQPMSRAEILREYLAENGYETLKERLVWDQGKLYCSMKVFYTGKNSPRSEEYYLIGEGLLSPPDPLLFDLIRREKARQARVMAGNRGKNIEKYERAKKILDGIARIRRDF